MDNSQTACAHRQIEYVRVNHPGGGCGDSWICRGCGTHFGPVAEPKAEDAPQPKERSGKDYAIEHAGYLADAVDHYLEERNKFDALDQADVGDQDSLNDHVRALRDCAFEFRKRAKRAADSVVQGETQLRTSADYAWHVREAYADGCECAMCKLVRELLAGVQGEPTRERLRDIISVLFIREKLRLDIADAWQMACFISAALRSETFRNSVTYDEEVQGEAAAKPALEKLLRWIVEDTRELAKGRSLEMSDIESLLAHAEEACKSVFGCSLSSFRDGEQGAMSTRPEICKSCGGVEGIAHNYDCPEAQE